MAAVKWTSADPDPFHIHVTGIAVVWAQRLDLQLPALGARPHLMRARPRQPSIDVVGPEPRAPGLCVNVPLGRIEARLHGSDDEKGLGPRPSVARIPRKLHG